MRCDKAAEVVIWNKKCADRIARNKQMWYSLFAYVM